MTTPIQTHVSALRSEFQRGTTAPESWRRAQLASLDRMLEERGDDFESALYADLRKPPTESQLTEIEFIRSEITYALANLATWMRGHAVPVPPALLPASASVRPEPLGVVLIIAPWNYPLMLALSPFVGAIAAGNAAVIKPSEHAPATSALLGRLLPEYLDVRAVRVIEGGIPETAELLAERFDHIFYTGGRGGAIHVARAAAEHLTPTTLELGGKSPLYIDESVDLHAAAKRIAWAKYVNAGQTCVAPDYVLATEPVIAELGPALARAIHDLYGNAPHANSDYGRIVNDAHFERLVAFLEDGDLVAGGVYRTEDRYIAPTVLGNVSRDASVMQEEIFGPILPLVMVQDLDDALEYVSAGDKPLGAYVFSALGSTRRRWEEETSSGALTFGAPMLHLSVPELPFGGVGPSGMGSYHGKRSFDTFSHEKALLTKPLAPDTLSPTIMPPYTDAKHALITNLLGKLR